MSFRTRLLVAFGVAVLVPLLLFAAGVRREMDRRLTAEYRARVGAAVEVVRAQLDRESVDIAGRLAAFAVALPRDNRFRLALQGDPGSRRYLLDVAGDAMRLSGLSLLEIQDSAGRVLSSGHFRNAYDRLEPALPRTLRSSGGPLLVRARTATGALLALARLDSLTIGGQPLTVIGGTGAEGFVGRLPRARDLDVLLSLPGDSSARSPAAVVGVVPLAFLDLTGSPALDSARLVVTGSPAALESLRRSVTSWSLLAAAATALLALGLAAWLSGRVSRPLAALADKTAAIDLDRLDQDFDTDRTDEIGALSRLLGAMTERLRLGAARLREAERRVAMGDLARQVNHDIKNGLAPIRHVLRHLDEVAHTDPASLASVLGERKGTLDSSLAYLDTLARNYAGLSPALRREPCDVNAVVEDVTRGSRGGVKTSLGSSLPAAAADRVVLRRILENLVGNAADSVAGEAGGSVIVSTESASGDGVRMVRITVADTGPGMSRDHLDRAFDDFFTTKEGGTGLGLSIVRRLVLDLGGTLRMDTEPGAGTRAIVELPVAEGPAR